MRSQSNQTVDQNWLDELGGLHDARINRVEVVDTDLLIVIDDLWSNFEGLPQYSGPMPGNFRLVGLTKTPVIDSQVTCESVMDFFVESGQTVKMKIVCFGQHVITAEGERLVWEPKSAS